MDLTDASNYAFLGIFLIMHWMKKILTFLGRMRIDGKKKFGSKKYEIAI